jgi:hypothetical protein
MTGGVIRRVVIASNRPVSLASAMTGHPAEFMAGAMAALHGLCGQSHAAAVHAAAAAARGMKLPDAELRCWIIRLAGERLGEHLRRLYMDENAAPLSASCVAALRSAIGAGQAAARRGTLSGDAAARLSLAMGTLEPLLDVCGETARPPLSSPGKAVDRLSPGDDDAVIAALATDSAFIRSPHLPGRTPETGPAARFLLSAADPEAAMAARLAEVRDAAALLLDPGGRASEGWITAGAAGPRAGYAAVETPRGRLFYRLVLGDGGNVVDARVLAPTEWNFHTAGPLARALTGFRPGREAAASIARRAAAFDPCVALRVSIESAADA